jgi:carbon monoxide dehydrogenase subunit G
MSTISSDKVLISRTDRVVFDFVSDFDNFGKLMPEQVTDWKSTPDTCSFTISGMASLSMRMSLRQPYDKLVMTSEGKTPFAFELKSHFKAIADDSTEAQLVFDAQLSPMIAMMATRPLQNFVNILVHKLKEYAEENL